MTSNQETAQLLKKVAAVFRVLEGDTFRVKAYGNAATAVENSSESIYELWQQGLLDKVPGIGEKLRSHLSEYFKTGKVRHFDALFKKVPAGMFPLMEIRGVGPVTAYKIAKKFKLNDSNTSLEELKKILAQGQLNKIPSFKEKTAARIKKALEINTKAKVNRMLLSEALTIAQDYLEYLKKSPVIKNAEMLGSLRRKVATVGDIDLAVSSDKPSEAMDYVTKYPKIIGVITKGVRLSHVKLDNGYEVDIKLAGLDEWGSLLQHYTGSKLHNIRLRTYALEKGLSLSEYGIKKGSKTVKFSDEKSFYSFLNMAYTPPEMREDKGEIELAIENKVPKLVDINDIKGDLHLHSDFGYPTSHDVGDDPLKDMLEYAIQNKYEYLGISDHNPKFQDLSETEKKKILTDRKNYLLASLRAYEKFVKNSAINLLIGLEVDIRPDGQLALSDQLIDEQDYLIVSIHSGFEADKEVTTNKIITALSHPKAVILGHPTGRILNRRDSVNADWEKIFKFCSANRKIIEINASPNRQDLPDDLIRQAISFGVKLIINTDSHHPGEMAQMKYGIWQARRGWASKKDIINTYSYKDLRAVLNL